MNPLVKNIDWPAKIFKADQSNFTALALEVFLFQHANNQLYRQYCDCLKIDPSKISDIVQIPFLPIRFFKTHKVTTTNFNAAVIFESSGTTQTINSKHYVKDTCLYQQSFTQAFQLFYGNPQDWCIIALLPSYLERNNSSLVMMADHLIRQSEHPQSGFYLNNYRQLHTTLQLLQQQQKKTLLIGVTFALLDFAEQFPMLLQHTAIMETGGMKGRRNDLTRQQVHEILSQAFQVRNIHSEYGMTELLSQAYSKGNGIFNCPPWMKILIREEDDPFAVHQAGATNITSGAVNIIDLANIYSCAFIATDDAGKLHPNNSCELLGRLDNTDIRGCSLLAL